MFDPSDPVSACAALVLSTGMAMFFVFALTVGSVL